MVRVYIQSPRWFVRPRNTDWIYTRRLLPRVQDYSAEVEFYPAQSMVSTLQANLRHMAGMAARRMRFAYREPITCYLDRKDFERSGCRVIYSHDKLPADAGSTPVLWHNSILDPEMAASYHRDPEALERERERAALGFSLATVVQVPTEAERQRLSQWFPKEAHKFRAVPFFLPGCEVIPQHEMETKMQPTDRLRCLFVGNEARRKGLDRVYEAFKRLPAELQEDIHLTVISSYAGGAVPAPELPHLTMRSNINHAEVMRHMREAHIFIMPSRFESYGLAYLEAMSQGTVPIVPDWEVQRELVDYGRSGIVTTGEPAHIASLLSRLVEDGEWRRKLACAARERFSTHYAPVVVAGQIATMMRGMVE